MTCKRCGGQFPEQQLDARFEGICPRCLAALALESSQEASEPSSGKTAPKEPPPLAPADTFHGLKIQELLGQGGMGVVYKALQAPLGRNVALKILPRRLAEDQGFLERFQREAKALAALSHPHIVAIHDFGTENGLPFIVMEYVEGVNLRQILAQGKLPPEQALGIVPQLCDALQYAHEEGIVHRDIKPENILLDKKGRVKITDFGLVKILGGAVTRQDTITRTNMLMGTPHYMAPEQIENPKVVDHRADIYSMGVVFYEMLTGELPIGRFAPPSRKVQVDVRLDEVVLKTLEKEPERRYQKASEVKEDVTRITTQAAVPSKVLPPKSRLAAGFWQGAAVAFALVAIALWTGLALALERSLPPRWALQEGYRVIAIGVLFLLLTSVSSLQARRLLADRPTARRRLLEFSVVCLLVIAVGTPYLLREIEQPRNRNIDLELTDADALTARTAQPALRPFRIEDVFFTEDDLPGAFQFDSPSAKGALPRSPFLATDTDELRSICGTLDYWLGIRNLAPSLLRRAYWATVAGDWFGYFALEFNEDSDAERMVSQGILTGEDRPLVDKWIHRAGRSVLLAYLTDDDLVNRVGFQHVVNRLHEKLGMTRPYELPGIEFAMLTEDDLLPGWSIPAEDAERRRNPFIARTAQELKEAVSQFNLPLQPEQLRGFYRCMIQPHDMEVLALDVPERSVRLKSAYALQPTLEDYDDDGYLFGSVVIIWQRGSPISEDNEAEGKDRAALKVLFHRKLGPVYADPPHDPLKEELVNAAAMPWGDVYKAWENPDKPFNIENLSHQNLTALILSLPAAGPDLQTNLESWSSGEAQQSYVRTFVDDDYVRPSIMAVSKWKLVSGKLAELDFGEEIILQVEFTMKDGKVVEFRLPKSGRRVVKQGRLWKYIPPNEK